MPLNNTKKYNRERDKIVYKYLLAHTDLGLGKNYSISKLIADPIEKRPNESYIAKQWGYSKVQGINPTFARRVLRFVYGDELYKDEINKDEPGCV
jgi:hypothetical protein